jgi:diketogulonate reductase-like aldo/keto reductase
MPTQLAREDIPPFVYGTAWKEHETARLTKLALEAGFRGIDTANQRKHYHEAGVGEALAEAVDEGIAEREELFLQTKFTYRAGQDHRLPYDPDAAFATQVEQSFESSLEHLQTDYVDSYVLHGPSTRAGLAEADHQVWEAMEKLARADRVRSLGVSNVSADQLAALIEWADIAPTFVQNRCFARTGWDAKVRQICDQNDIVYQGFSLLTANRRELHTPELSAIAERHDKTVPQIVFRFAIEVGMLPLTGTTDPEHMRQDLECLDFELDKTEVAAIERIAAL